MKTKELCCSYVKKSGRCIAKNSKCRNVDRQTKLCTCKGYIVNGKPGVSYTGIKL